MSFALPRWMIESLDLIALRLQMSRHAVIKILIAEQLDLREDIGRVATDREKTHAATRPFGHASVWRTRRRRSR